MSDAHQVPRFSPPEPRRLSLPDPRLIHTHSSTNTRLPPVDRSLHRKENGPTVPESCCVADLISSFQRQSYRQFRFQCQGQKAIIYRSDCYTRLQQIAKPKIHFVAFGSFVMTLVLLLAITAACLVYRAMRAEVARRRQRPSFVSKISRVASRSPSVSSVSLHVVPQLETGSKQGNEVRRSRIRHPEEREGKERMRASFVVPRTAVLKRREAAGEEGMRDEGREFWSRSGGGRR